MGKRQLALGCEVAKPSFTCFGNRPKYVSPDRAVSSLRVGMVPCSPSHSQYHDERRDSDAGWLAGRINGWMTGYMSTWVGGWMNRELGLVWEDA